MKPKAIITALIIAVALVGAIIFHGRSKAIAPVSGETRDLTVTSLGVFWVSAPEEPGTGPATVFCVPGGHGKPVSVLQAWDVRSIFVEGRSLYALIESSPAEDAGELVIRDLKTGQETRHKGLHHPQRIWSDGSLTAWAESRTPRAEAVVHVPIMRAVDAVRAARDDLSKPYLVAVSEGSNTHFSGDLLGLADGKLYWLEQVGWEFSQGRTAINRNPVGGGDTEVLARPRGRNVAVINHGKVYWTEYSEERAVASSGRAVRSTPMDQVAPATITDWLGSEGTLLTEGKRTYYASERWLWAVPEKLSEPVPLVRIGTHQRGTVALFRGNIYSITKSSEDTAIVRTPISWRGRLRAGLSFLRPRIAQGGGAL